MRQCIAFPVVLLLLPFLCPAQEIKLPVFFLRYDGGLGSEEIEPSSQRHKATLRIKEEWSDILATNLGKVKGKEIEMLLQQETSD